MIPAMSLFRRAGPLCLGFLFMLGCIQLSGSPNSQASFALSKKVGTLAVVLPTQLTPDLNHELEDVAQRFFGDRAHLEYRSRRVRPSLQLPALSQVPHALKQNTPHALTIPTQNKLMDSVGSTETVLLGGLACTFKVLDRRSHSPTKLAACLGWLTLTIIESASSEYGVVLVHAFEPRSLSERSGIAVGTIVSLYLVWRQFSAQLSGKSTQQKLDDEPAQFDHEESLQAAEVSSISDKPQETAASRLSSTVDKEQLKRLFALGEQIGQGSDGSKMFRGRMLSGDLQVAVKCVSEPEIAQREISILLAVGAHENVVRLVTHFQVENLTQIVLGSLCTQSLKDVIEGSGNLKLSAADLTSVTRRTSMVKQLISGTAHLHAQQLVHTRLTPETIRFCDGMNQLQICGLGSAIRMDQNEDLVNQNGRSESALSELPWGASPETSAGAVFTHSADVFAVGCLTYYIFTGGAHPFGKRSVRAQRVARGEASLPGLLAKVPLAASFVHSALKACTLERASIATLQQHPALWSASKTSDFLCDLSDRLDSADESQRSPLEDAIEKCAPRVCGQDWSRKLDPWMREDLFTRRGYRVTALRDLLRAVRNKTRHCLVLPKESAGSIEPTAVGVSGYFVSKFPRLVLDSYQALANIA